MASLGAGSILVLGNTHALDPLVLVQLGKQLQSIHSDLSKALQDTRVSDVRTYKHVQRNLFVVDTTEPLISEVSFKRGSKTVLYTYMQCHACMHVCNYMYMYCICCSLACPSQSLVDR